MRKHVIATRIFAATAVIGIVGYNAWNRHTASGCAVTGDHWGSAVSRCYPRSCFYEGDCGGPWVSTKIPCADVRPGETEAMLNFYFGNPDRKDGDRIIWSAGKPERLAIEAKVIAGKLFALKCPDGGAGSVL